MAKAAATEIRDLTASPAQDGPAAAQAAAVLLLASNTADPLARQPPQAFAGKAGAPRRGSAWPTRRADRAAARARSRGAGIRRRAAPAAEPVPIKVLPPEIAAVAPPVPYVRGTPPPSPVRLVAFHRSEFSSDAGAQIGAGPGSVVSRGCRAARVCRPLPAARAGRPGLLRSEAGGAVAATGGTRPRLWRERILPRGACALQRDGDRAHAGEHRQQLWLLPVLGQWARAGPEPRRGCPRRPADAAGRSAGLEPRSLSAGG